MPFSGLSVTQLEAFGQMEKLVEHTRKYSDLLESI